MGFIDMMRGIHDWLWAYGPIFGLFVLGCFALDIVLKKLDEIDYGGEDQD